MKTELKLTKEYVRLLQLRVLHEDKINLLEQLAKLELKIKELEGEEKNDHRNGTSNNV